MNQEATSSYYTTKFEADRHVLVAGLSDRFGFFRLAIENNLLQVFEAHNHRNRKEYHDFNHTLNVFYNVVNMHLVALQNDEFDEERLNDEELALLLTTVIFHDIVYDSSKKEKSNEELSAETAINLLGDSVSTEQANFIKELILSTTTSINESGLVRTHYCDVPNERLQLMIRYLQDADLGNLGDENFPRATIQLMREYKIEVENFEQFLKTQLNILGNFEYNTNVGKYVFSRVASNYNDLVKFISLENFSVRAFIKYFEVVGIDQ